MGLISSQYKRVPANYYIDMKRAQLAAMNQITHLAHLAHLAALDIISDQSGQSSQSGERRSVRLRAFDTKPRLVKRAK